jgi:hypothetical protein
MASTTAKAKQSKRAGPLQPRTATVVKRSITVNRDVDEAVLRQIRGRLKYSQAVNEALLLWAQAEGIDKLVADVEKHTGPIMKKDELEADRRLEDAKRRAKLRRRRVKPR